MFIRSEICCVVCWLIAAGATPLYASESAYDEAIAPLSSQSSNVDRDHHRTPNGRAYSFVVSSPDGSASVDDLQQLEHHLAATRHLQRATTLEAKALRSQDETKADALRREASAFRADAATVHHELAILRIESRLKRLRATPTAEVQLTREGEQGVENGSAMLLTKRRPNEVEDLRHQEELFNLKILERKRSLEAVLINSRIPFTDDETKKLEMRRKASDLQTSALELKYQMELQELEHQLQTVSTSLTEQRNRETARPCSATPPSRRVENQSLLKREKQLDEYRLAVARHLLRASQLEAKAFRTEQEDEAARLQVEAKAARYDAELALLESEVFSAEWCIKKQAR